MDALGLDLGNQGAAASKSESHNSVSYSYREPIFNIFLKCSVVHETLNVVCGNAPWVVCVVATAYELPNP